MYPIAVRNKRHIQTIVDKVALPVNILTLSGIPNLETLKQIGVVRVSLGSSFLKIALRAMRKLATDLQQHNGLTKITENPITNDYLKQLINKNKL
ncbi:MAG: isocitrate lyase/phosphoenolpyruvate mutase family protein [Bacteroidia bacterium]|nr:isocitrate lyase/phosphoenolpyruvate mutase family protein [Bacteroidia bacterium]